MRDASPTKHTFTRWREIDNPVDSEDPIGCLSLLVTGKLPHSFVLMVGDLELSRIGGPYRFISQEMADSFMEESTWVKRYLIIPGPEEEL